MGYSLPVTSWVTGNGDVSPQSLNRLFEIGWLERVNAALVTLGVKRMTFNPPYWTARFNLSDGGQMVMLNNRKRRPTHPGTLLREEVLPEMGLSQGEFAAVLGVSRRTVNEVLLEKRPVTVDLAHRLARALGTSPEKWLRLQQEVDIWDSFNANEHVYEKIKPLASEREEASDD